MKRDIKYIIKRIIIGVGIALFLGFLNSCEVHAAIEGHGWYEKNVDNVILSSRILNWNSANSYSPINTTWTEISSNASASVPVGLSSVTAFTNGISFQIYVEQQLKVNYLYSIELFVCTTSNVSFDMLTFQLSSGLNPNSSATNVPVYQYGTVSTASVYYLPVGTSDPYFKSFNTCGVMTGLISPSEEGAWYDVRIRNNTSLTFVPYLMGYSMQELGIYSSSLESSLNSIVKNSGLATASSITEVKNSVNEVKTELNNVNSSIEQQTQQQQQNHQETMDTITSTDVDSPDNAFSEFESYLPENGVITQLITLPISLFQKVLSSINGSCSEYNLGNLLGTDLKLPCINISNYLGSTLWNVIDVLFSGLFVLIISKKMIKVFNNFTNMEEGDVLD